MPIFEYRCEECGHRFDAFFRRAGDADEEKLLCENCGSDRVRKLFSVIGIGGGSSDRGSSISSCTTST
jgi:putative FmdB family regulatory protein